MQDDLPKFAEEFGAYLRQMNKVQPSELPFAAGQAFPAIARWVQGYGHIEIGKQEGLGFVVAAFDDSGLVFEDNKAATLAEAMAALEQRLEEWFKVGATKKVMAPFTAMVKKGKTTRREAEPRDRCELCNRKNKPLTKHHLIPRAVHTKKRFINRFGKAEMIRRGLMICKLCHDGIHDLIPSEKELAESFNTKELLLDDERIRKHVEWVRRQK